MCENEVNKPNDKQKIIELMDYVGANPVDLKHDIKEYSRADIEKMLSNIELVDTYNVEQINDYINIIISFYIMGQEMGMSPFIARAALKELSELAFAIYDEDCKCDGNCKECEHNEEHHH